MVLSQPIGSQERLTKLSHFKLYLNFTWLNSRSFLHRIFEMSEMRSEQKAIEQWEPCTLRSFKCSRLNGFTFYKYFHSFFIWCKLPADRTSLQRLTVLLSQGCPRPLQLCRGHQKLLGQGGKFEILHSDTPPLQAENKLKIVGRPWQQWIKIFSCNEFCLAK